MNLKTTMNFDRQEALEQLRQGNTEVLRGLPPVLSMQLGLAMQQEQGNIKQPSPINMDEVTKAMVNGLKDSGVKEMLLKRIEEERENDVEN